MTVNLFPNLPYLWSPMCDILHVESLSQDKAVLTLVLGTGNFDRVCHATTRNKIARLEESGDDEQLNV